MIAALRRFERVQAVVGGAAFDADIVQEFPDIFCLLGSPSVIGREELHHFVPHFGDGTDGARQVLAEFVTD